MKSLKLLNLLFLITAYVSQVHTSTESTIFDISDAKELFNNFIDTFDKHYKNVAEYQKRFSIFVEHLKEVNQRNSRNDSVVFGITSIFDLATEEFLGGCLTEIPFAKSTSIDKSLNQKLDKLGAAPRSWDWREQGAVTQTKNQGGCGSCWAFSAIGCLESQHAIKYGKLQALSEQQILDCTSSWSGCNGGWPYDAFQGAIKAGGVMLESDYPYSAKKGHCDVNGARTLVKPIKAKMYPQGLDEEWLKRLIYNYGPVSAAMHFSGAFVGYRVGIANNDNMDCYDQSPNHAIVIVGYGEDKGTPYWIIKNSYGQDWGENGYFKLHRGSNACGISSYIATVEIE